MKYLESKGLLRLLRIETGKGGVSRKMRSKEEQEQIIKRALSVSSVEAPEPQLPAVKTECPAEPLAAQILADNEPNEVTQILDVWQRVFGMKLDRERVARHLAMLANWQSRNKE